jgi:hypothetical protein
LNKQERALSELGSMQETALYAAIHQVSFITLGIFQYTFYSFGNILLTVKNKQKA